MKKEKRTGKAAVKVYLTDEEHKRLDTLSSGSGYSKSSYMRSVLNSMIPRETPPMKFHDLIFELNKIGTNINQIAKVANMTGSIESKEYQKQYKELQKVVRDLQKEYLMPERIDDGND